MTAPSLGELLAGLIARDLRSLGRELEAYPEEMAMWTVPAGIANSGGTLALHLCGNLNHYIGAVLGGSGYVRDRDAEFTRRHVPRTELLAMIEATIGVTGRTLESLGPDALAATYPIPVGGVRMRTDDFLVHLCTHLTYHLGQLDYHRRLTAAPGTVRTVAAAELRTAEKEDPEA